MSVIEPFIQYRPLLFSIAYRMLGSVADAEDIVQEAFLRWRPVAESEVESPKSYLTTVVSRLCIDQLRSARIQREQYIGPWLPEPVIGEQPNDPAEAVVLAESLSMAFLVLLESLTPVERAVFLLHEVFDYSYGEVAGMVGKSEANCRQIARRAREHVAARRPRFEPCSEQQERLAQKFFDVCRSGDLPALLALLAEDITIWSDGGGKVGAALNPIHGRENVGRLIAGVLTKFWSGATPEPVLVNGQPGIVASVDGHLAGVVVLEIAGDQIRSIRAVLNPEKLRGIPVPRSSLP